MSSNLVIVAIPEQEDRVWKISSEKVPHLTLLFLGESEKADVEQIVQFVQHATEFSEHGPFYLDVDRRDELGDDKADVLFFNKRSWNLNWIKSFRSQLLQNGSVRAAYDSVEQFPEWQPHLTLGYPESPAKNPSNDDDRRLYSVNFDRIAVWTGDFDGPEFRLEYPDREDQFGVGGALAYSDVAKTGATAVSDILEHFGTKGMRWGIRKAAPFNKRARNAENIISTIEKRQAGKPARQAKKEVKRLEKADKNWKKDFEKQKGFGFDDQKFTKEYNAKWKDHDFSKEDWAKPSPTYQKYIDGYFNSMSSAYAKQLAEHFGSSPSGKLEAHHVPGTDLVKLRVKDTAKHADEELITLRIKRNASGLIVAIEPVEDSMEQAVARGEEFIEHFGVKGMRWGVVKQKVGAGLRKTGRGLGHLANALGDGFWQNSVYSDVKHAEVHNRVGKEIDEKMYRLQTSPKYRGKNLKADKALKREYKQDVAKVSDAAYRRAVKEVYGDNITGTKTAVFVNDVRGARIEVRDKATGEKAAEAPLNPVQEDINHSALSHAETAPDITIQLKLDDNDQISGVGQIKVDEVEHSFAHSAELGEEFILEHYGVKGMRWGFRREAPTAVAPSATSKVPHGKKRKTKIKTEGGENHPATEDALKVAQARVKLHKSGPAALSNQELRDVATRLQLEQQVTQLSTRRGGAARFVKNLLAKQGEQEINARINANRQQRLRPQPS